VTTTGTTAGEDFSRSRYTQQAYKDRVTTYLNHRVTGFKGGKQ